MTEHQSEETRRNQILRAALELFTNRGYEETPMEQIADKAGLSKGAIYWYFDGKLAILLALTDEAVQASIDRLQELAHSKYSGPRALYLVHREMYDNSCPTPGQERLIGQLVHLSNRYPDIQSKLIEYQSAWDVAAAGLIEEGIRGGVFRQVNARALSQAIGAMYGGLRMRQEVEPEIDAVGCLEVATRLFFDALIIDPALKSSL